MPNVMEQKWCISNNQWDMLKEKKREKKSEYISRLFIFDASFFHSHKIFKPIYEPENPLFINPTQLLEIEEWKEAGALNWKKIVKKIMIYGMDFFGT